MGFELACELASQGHTAHLITNGATMGSSENLIVHNLGSAGFWRSATSTVLKLEAEGKLDLVHVQNLVIHRSLAPYLGHLRRRSKLPVVAYCCQLPGLSLSNWVDVLRREPWEALTNKIGMLAPSMATRWTIRHVDKTIASSKFIGGELSRSRPTNPIDIIPPFFNGTRLRSSLEKEVRKAGFPTLVYLGSHKALRGEDDFLRMLGFLKRYYPNLKGVIVTPQPIPDRVNTLARSQGLLENIEFLSRGKQLDVPSIMRAADLYVFTGLSPIGSIDPPLSIIEAMILGTPVVSYDTGGISELLDPAHLAPYHDYPALGRLGRKFLDEKSNRVLRPDLLEEHSSATATARFLDAYEGLVA